MNKWVRGTNATVISIAVIVIFIIVTLFLNSLKGIQWDLSANKKYSLSEQSITALGKLDKDVKVTLFTGGNTADDSVMYRDVGDLLKEYEKHSNHITYEEVDPNRDPARAQQYQIDQTGTIVFELGDQQKKVYSYELFAPGQQEGSYSFNGEEKFTQSILNLTSDVKHPVYFLNGHNEMQANLLGSFRSSLAGENYVVNDLNLVKEGKIPDDAEAIFIIGPQIDLNAQETTLLQDFVKNKGRLFISLGYANDMQNMKNLDSILATINVTSTKGVVIENGQTLYNNPLTIVPNYGFHTIVNDLDEQSRVVVLPVAVSFTTDSANTDWQSTPLLRSSDKAYAETNLSQLTSNKPVQDGTDPKGPLDLAYAIENKDGKPKAVVIGNAQFLQDQIIAEQGNRDFALNSVNWLQEQTDMVTIRPREEAALQQAFVMPNQAKWIFYGTVVIFPLAILVLGGAIWWRRRKG